MLSTPSSKSVRVQSVDRAFAILELLATADKTGFGLAQVAQSLGLKAPTTRNLLKTLIARGYVKQDSQTQRYGLGPSCGALGHAFQENVEISQIAQPHLCRLSTRLKDAAVLGMLQLNRVAFIARAESENLVAVNFKHVWVADAYNSVCGRILLAGLADDQLSAFMRENSVSRSTAEDLNNEEEVRAMVAVIREQGYYSYWRSKNKVFAVGAPVFDVEGEVLASLGVSIMTAHLPADGEKGAIRIICNVARAISVEMGWKGKRKAINHA